MVLFNCIQAALFSAVTAFAGPEGEEPAQPDELAAPQDEDSEADAPRRACTASSNTSPTRRQWASVWPSSREPWKCLRSHDGGVAPAGYPDCWTVARNAYGCTEVVDID